jgi:hypothetical protein
MPPLGAKVLIATMRQHGIVFSLADDDRLVMSSAKQGKSVKDIVGALDPKVREYVKMRLDDIRGELISARSTEADDRPQPALEPVPEPEPEPLPGSLSSVSEMTPDALAALDARLRSCGAIGHCPDCRAETIYIHPDATPQESLWCEDCNTRLKKGGAPAPSA